MSPEKRPASSDGPNQNRAERRADPMPGPGSSIEEIEGWVDRNGFVGGGPIPPREIPESEWPRHPLLARALAEGWIDGDVFAPRGLTREQGEALARFRVVDDGEQRRLRMPPRVNADWFMDGHDIHTSEDLIRRITPDIQRYYLHCLEPGGDYVETIIAVTRAVMRLFFTTRRGERLEEVGEGYFIRYRESETRLLLELDSAAMRATEKELHFVRSVVDKKPDDLT